MNFVFPTITEELFETTMAVAEGRLTKDETAEVLRRLAALSA